MPSSSGLWSAPTSRSLRWPSSAMWRCAWRPICWPFAASPTPMSRAGFTRRWYNSHSIFVSQVKEKAVDILLVDDNPLMQQLIARFLGDLGYQVGVAGRADEAITIARDTPPLLFMIDMHLPDL